MADEPFCYLTTTGRRTGAPHEIEIWFAPSAGDGGTLYLLSGGGESSDWVRNLRADPAATVRVGRGGVVQPCTARFPEPGSDEDRFARDAVFAKYDPGYDGDLAGWRERSLVVALDLAGPA